MRQDHHVAHDQPAHRAARGPDPHRRRRTCSTDGPRAAAPGHRLRDPAGRPLPPPARGRQRRHGAPPPRLGPRPRGRAGQRAARAGRPRPGPATAGASPTSSPAASANGSAWPGPSAATRPCCSWTSPSAPSTPSPASACSSSSSTCRRSSRRRSSSSPTTSRRRPSSGTASPCSPRAACSSSTTRRRRSWAGPATPFVADFVGADRGVRRLAVMRDRARRPVPPPVVTPDSIHGRRPGAPPADRTAEWAVVVDDDGRLLGWVDARAGPDGTVERPHSCPSRSRSPWAPRCGPRSARCSSTTCAGSRSSTSERYLGVLTPNRLHAAMRRSVGGHAVEG